MSRLVDYFVIVGFDHEKERGGLSSGVILQRFPEVNWDDTPFHDGIEWFCQPQGWALSTERSEPRFYVSVLTDVDANKHYCACLCFNETVAITPTKPADEDEESLDSTRAVSNITHHSIMYAPKCIVIVSRQDYIDTFRNCLGIIYTVWVENLGVPLETLVGNLLGCVLVPPPGGPQVRFSIGAGDRQALQPPAAPPLPVTHTSVHMLLRLLGIHNSVTLWCAVMSEHKVLLVSLAAARLAAACRALAALMFPFRYAHVYIPLLPSGLVEVLATPTPFLIGVHSSLKEEVSELLDVIVADLDVGSLQIPAGISIPRPEGKLLSSLQDSLALVMQPELKAADSAFAPPPPITSLPHMLDKEIRAVFMRTLAKLLQGYRHCLTIIRIHPSPVLTFHKGGFMGARGLSQCQFTQRLLDSMFFNGFVAERGPPWRQTDVFDDLMLNLPEQVRVETLHAELQLQHIQELAMQLHTNENPNPQTYQQRILRPPEGASLRIHQPPLPRLDPQRVKEVIDELANRNTLNNTKLSALRAPQPRIVPVGTAPTGADAEHGLLLLTNSARRLEVLRACIAAIFECRYADARKSFPAAVRALRAAGARAALTNELAARLHGNKQLLQPHQFELLCRLMNCALQSCTALDEHSIAHAMLPLSTGYCRKLCTGVIQYAYMCIQEHPVWTSQQFWESAFYTDVQRDIKALYLSSPQHQIRAPSPRDDSEYISLLKAQEPSALEIAAEQMRLWPNMDPEKQREFVSSEESTLYSQAIHYANRMVYLLLPLEGASRRSDARPDDDRLSHSVTNSVAESDSADAESGFEEAEPGEAAGNVTKMVSRFVDKVCTEGGVTADHVRCLHQMVPGVVHMHTETLDAVARESRRLPPVQKPRLIAPCLLPGESISGPALRCVLVPDGRAHPLLPAEGALFLTNYRLVFRGAPLDPYACEQVVIRSFPVTALTKEKQIRTNYLPHLEQSLQEGLQLRAATFQLIKVALDEEVSSEQTEAFRKQISRARLPAHPLLHFAFPPPPAPHRLPAAHATLKGFAKKTLLNTARKAGLKPKQSKRRAYVLPSTDARSLTSPPLMSSLSADTLSLDEVESCPGDDKSTMGSSGVGSGLRDARTLERLQERAYARDWARLGLAGSPFRLTHCNALYTLCRSYPALISVPESISDESARRIARCYRQGRLPVLTYRHARTRAVLARSSASHHKGVIGMLKASSHQTQGGAQGGNEPTSSIEQERYLCMLAGCAGAARGSLQDSSLSLDSLGGEESAHHTPVLPALSVHHRVGTSRWGSLKGRHAAPAAPLPHHANKTVSGETQTLRRASLYVISEKGISSAVNGCEHLQVEYVECRAMRHAFKKLLRAAVPASATDDDNFYKLIEESGWLWQLKSLFQVSGAVVDLVDLQGASVLLSLEDGWDVTAQISSVAQVCLDPYYRTLDGFRTLVEKEWLALGHKFSSRSDLTAPQHPFTPVFLQFLDCVHQLQKQFPLAFEFNEYYLRFLAHHTASCRFRTFLSDCEAERAELGLTAADDRRQDQARMGVEMCAEGAEEAGGGLCRAHLGLSIFDYIDRAHQKAPTFYNFLYTPDFDNPVLRPISSVCALEVWQYYVSEELSTGVPYDVEAAPPGPAAPAAPGPDRGAARRTVVNGYDNISRCLPDAFTALLERRRQLELELGHLPQKWRVRWDQLELPNTLHLQRVSSMSSALIRSWCRLAHKRSTLEVVAAGRLPPPAPAPAAPHRYAPLAQHAPAACDHCRHLLWGPVKSGVRCGECGATVHERCAEVFPAACRPAPAAPAAPPPAAINNGAAPLQSQQYYEQFSSNVAEDRTHEGHLYKRGALLKGWKQRWFVLDSIKHQLRYYDAMEDSHCKGFIDLGEVLTVTPAPVAPGPPKKCDERSFFDLRTSRRTYNFCASDAAAAQEWIEKLQACLQ